MSNYDYWIKKYENSIKDCKVTIDMIANTTFNLNDCMSYIIDHDVGYDAMKEVQAAINHMHTVQSMMHYDIKGHEEVLESYKKEMKSKK